MGKREKLINEIAALAKRANAVDDNASTVLAVLAATMQADDMAMPGVTGSLADLTEMFGRKLEKEMGSYDTLGKLFGLRGVS